MSQPSAGSGSFRQPAVGQGPTFESLLAEIKAHGEQLMRLSIPDAEAKTRNKAIETSVTAISKYLNKVDNYFRLFEICVSVNQLPIIGKFIRFYLSLEPGPTVVSLKALKTLITSQFIIANADSTFILREIDKFLELKPFQGIVEEITKDNDDTELEPILSKAKNIIADLHQRGVDIKRIKKHIAEYKVALEAVARERNYFLLDLVDTHIDKLNQLADHPPKIGEHKAVAPQEEATAPKLPTNSTAALGAGDSKQSQSGSALATTAAALTHPLSHQPNTRADSKAAADVKDNSDPKPFELPEAAKKILEEIKTHITIMKMSEGDDYYQALSGCDRAIQDYLYLRDYDNNQVDFYRELLLVLVNDIPSFNTHLETFLIVLNQNKKDAKKYLRDLYEKIQQSATEEQWACLDKIEELCVQNNFSLQAEIQQGAALTTSVAQQNQTKQKAGSAQPSSEPRTTGSASGASQDRRPNVGSSASVGKPNESKDSKEPSDPAFLSASLLSLLETLSPQNSEHVNTFLDLCSKILSIPPAKFTNPNKVQLLTAIRQFCEKTKFPIRVKIQTGAAPIITLAHEPLMGDSSKTFIKILNELHSLNYSGALHIPGAQRLPLETLFDRLRFIRAELKSCDERLQGEALSKWLVRRNPAYGDLYKIETTFLTRCIADQKFALAEKYLSGLDQYRLTVKELDYRSLEIFDDLVTLVNKDLTYKMNHLSNLAQKFHKFTPLRALCGLGPIPKPRKRVPDHKQPGIVTRTTGDNAGIPPQNPQEQARRVGTLLGLPLMFANAANMDPANFDAAYRLMETICKENPNIKDELFTTYKQALGSFTHLPNEKLIEHVKKINKLQYAPATKESKGQNPQVLPATPNPTGANSSAMAGIASQTSSPPKQSAATGATVVATQDNRGGNNVLPSLGGGPS